MTSATPVYPKPKGLAVVIGLMSILLLFLGVQLTFSGGSPYFLVSGLTLALCGLLLFKGDPRGASLYGIFLIITYLWSFYEVGLDAWALMPRVAMFSVLGFWFLVPRVRRGLLQEEPEALTSKIGTRYTAILASVLLILLYINNTNYKIQTPSALGTGLVNNESGQWSHYGATKKGTRYAPADQINLENVHLLERAWETRTGVPGTFKGTPIQVGDGLYLCTGQNIILSLDPDNGEERWRFDPQIDTPQIGFWDTCRGVTHYEAPNFRSLGVCEERIFTATTDARLIAVNKATGERCDDFGDNGEISLLPGMGDVKPGFYFVTSPPTIANDVLVLGGWVFDNVETDEPSGVVRGFDPISGDLLWAWDMGREDRAGLPPEGDTYTRGTPNVWSLTSADEELGLIYLPTGNATPDYYGGHRSEAMEKYSSSIVALEARTGRVRWHFQTTHHDIFDYDVPSQPSLVDIPINGEVRKAVIVPTKRAEIFVFDRETGEPLTEIAELPVPQTDLPDETTSETQPFSVGMPSFARDYIREADMWGITPFDHALCRIQYRGLRYEGPLTPPTTQGTLLYPGVAGGMNWGSVAVDEVNNLMVVNSMHNPSVVRLYPRDQLNGDEQYGIGGTQLGTPYAAYSFFFLSPIFTPCLRPPYGEMAVVDLASQEVLWRRGLGTSQDQGPLGIASNLPLPMGMFYNAGSIVTGGGLVFMGGAVDSTLRAINIFNGEEVWTEDLGASSTATPMSYVSPSTGKQYVILTLPNAGNGLQLESSANPLNQRETSGGSVIAYALPD
jgi:quinate dehydrogenase (quinone)